jgi:MoaA/NifB/PqqE/SkfB family radical SAM enzyme
MGAVRAGDRHMPKEKEQVQQQRREALRRSKPLVHEKIVKIADRIRQGEFVPLIAIAYDTVCNLKCKHCCIDNMRYDAPSLTIDHVRELCRQADALGIAQLNLAGGEPLMFKGFDDLIAAISPEKFYIGLDTNGLLINPETAKHLKSIGVDKVKVSIDDIDEDTHNDNRNARVYRRAMDSILIARKAGLHAIINTVATNANVRNGHMERLAKFGQDNGIDINVLVLVPMGKVDGRTDLQITAEDTAAMWELSLKYPVFHRDIFGGYGIEYGCKAGNINIYITKYGETYPCYGIPITFGNVMRDSLSDILGRMASIRWFKEHQKLCLSAENKFFIEKYLTKTFGRKEPLNWQDAFDTEDYVS